MKNLNEIKSVLPYNLQFFAETSSEQSEMPETKSIPHQNQVPDIDSEPQLTPEEQVAQLIAKVKTLEIKSDKAASDAADWKKKYRETLDSKAQLDLEKAEREAIFQSEFEGLKRENTINKMAKSFIGMGYTEDQAVKAATAQLDGDYDELFRIQHGFLTARDKAREAEWMKKLPAPPSGGSGMPEDAFIKGFDKG